MRLRTRRSTAGRWSASWTRWDSWRRAASGTSSHGVTDRNGRIAPRGSARSRSSTTGRPRPRASTSATFWGRSRQEFERKLPSFLAVIRLSPAALGKVRAGRWRYARILEESEPDPDGWTTCALRTDGIEVAHDLVLGLGADADVLDPMDLRSAVLADARVGRAGGRQRFLTVGCSLVYRAARVADATRRPDPRFAARRRWPAGRARPGSRRGRGPLRRSAAVGSGDGLRRPSSTSSSSSRCRWPRPGRHSTGTEAVDPLAPAAFLRLGDAELLAIGFSRQKARYVRELARPSSTARSTSTASLRSTTTKPATPARPVGNRAVDGDDLLLMCLRRPDVWPAGDIALQQAVAEVKALPGRPDPSRMDELAEPWRPWRAVAARILWHHYLSSRGRG